MKGFIYFLLFLAVIAGGVSAYWYKAKGMSIDEQIVYVKSMISNSKGGEAASNTADSASKLGRVLKKNFDDAQDVYQNGAEAKYE